jgi:O-antigen biosynthesis protein
MFVKPFVEAFPKVFPNSFSTTENDANKCNKSSNYLNMVADKGGCGAYRIIWPEILINFSNLGDSTSLTRMVYKKDFYADFRVVKVQRQAAQHQKEFVAWLKSIQKEMGFKIMYEVDDVVFHEEIPDYNIYKEHYVDDNIRQNAIDIINMVDEVTVPCKYMRDLYIEKTGKTEISVVPNFHPRWWIGRQYDYKNVISSYESNRNKPRIVYSGSGAHFDVKNKTGQQDDFSHVLKFIIDNVDKYQFVFIGAYPLPLGPLIQSKKIEFHPWQTLINYPEFLKSLDAQLFIAPLQDNRFNRSKSDIKYIESSVLGIPCMCQDMVTYKDAPDFLRFTDHEDLTDKVDRILNWKNRKNYYKLVPSLRKLGESRFLERPENIGCFMEALNTDFNNVSRKYMSVWND